MIEETVKCDMCGVEIPKEEKHRWHNINIVRHIKISKSRSNDLPASFHVCTDDLKNILFEIIGVNCDEKHQEYLLKKISSKLRLSI